MAPSIGDVIRVVAKMSDGSGDVQNVYHCKIAGTTAPSNGVLLVNCATIMDDAYDYFDGSVSDDISFDSIAAYNVTADEPVGETTWSTLTSGGSSGNKLPPQVTPLVLFTTAVLNSLGKKYLPVMTAAGLDPDGSITSAILAAMSQYATELLSGIDAGLWTADFGNYRKATDTFIPWVAAIARDLYATQRRRYTGSCS